MSERVTKWLTEIGLGEHAATFADNDIDFELLPRLSADDLKELGFSIGHRRRFLDAIENFDAAPAEHPSTAKAPEPIARSDAERRQLTVMFCDMVGSTELSQKLDPEELGEVIRSFQNAATGEITRLGGYVARYMGDGVLAYFGWPRAHEDDAERAVRTAVSLMSVLTELKTPDDTALSARTGIATGLVVVGDLIGGEGGAQEETVVGETPNLAARLQALADPGQIIVAETTRALLGDLFDFQDLGQHQLKGLSSPVPAYAVLGERTLEIRFSARSAAGLLPLTGRDQELSLLLERWRRAKAGEGQVLLLSGEAGIGKSRITRALIDAVGEDEHFRVNYQCSPYHEDSALYPAIRQLTFASGIQPDDEADARFEKLERLLEQSSIEDTESRALIATMLGIDCEQRYGALDMPAEQARNRTLQVLMKAMLSLAGARPLLFVVEDIHWVDPTTLEFIELALDRIETARILMLITARPTFEHGFGGHPIVSRLALNRLGRDDINAIISRITDGKPLPGSLVEEIAAKTDGVPLFIEELTKTVLDSGVLVLEGDAYVLASPEHELAIPSSLHDSLMARLDRLQPVKEVAQVAACIGREFGYRLLAAVTPETETELQQALDQLVAAELIFRRGTPPTSSYTFKHALVRDAAYESLLKSRRQANHANIATELVNIVADIENNEPEVLAQHYAAAGNSEAAISYWRRAAERSAAMSSGLEAARHCERAISLLETLAQSEARDREELALRLDQAWALQLTHGPAQPAVGSAFARALELCPAVGEPGQHVAALIGMTRHTFWRDGPKATQAYYQPALDLAAQTDNAADAVVANYFVGTSRMVGGEDKLGLSHLETAWDLFSSGAEHSLTFRLGHNQGISTLIVLAWANWSLGRPSIARSYADQGLQYAQEISHPLTQTVVRVCTAAVFELLGERRLDNIRIGRALAEEYGFTVWAGYGDTCLGWLKFCDGEVDEGLALTERGIEGWRESGSRAFLTDRLARFGGMCVDAGQYDRGRSLLQQAEQCASDVGEWFWFTEVQRHLGRLALFESGDADTAEQYFHLALETANARESSGFALRAAIDLARHWHNCNRGDEARSILSEYSGRFEASEDSGDLRTARSLLDQYGQA